MNWAAGGNRYDALSAGYDRSHGRWLRHAGGQAQCAFEGAAAALLRPGAAVLDAACGTGTVARRLLAGARGTIDLTLLDAAPRMLDRCADIPGRRIVGYIEDLPFGSGMFDLVLCAWGLETLPSPRPALDEFLRVTRPDGYVCLVFCADRPSQSLAGRALRGIVAKGGLGMFLDHGSVAETAMRLGAKAVTPLHCNGPAAAVILHR